VREPADGDISLPSCDCSAVCRCTSAPAHHRSCASHRPTTGRCSNLVASYAASERNTNVSEMPRNILGSGIVLLKEIREERLEMAARQIVESSHNQGSDQQPSTGCETWFSVHGDLRLAKPRRSSCAPPRTNRTTATAKSVQNNKAAPNSTGSVSCGKIVRMTITAKTVSTPFGLSDLLLKGTSRFFLFTFRPNHFLPKSAERPKKQIVQNGEQNRCRPRETKFYIISQTNPPCKLVGNQSLRKNRTNPRSEFSDQKLVRLFNMLNPTYERWTRSENRPGPNLWLLGNNRRDAASIRRIRR
jgi:hypothetical protein